MKVFVTGGSGVLGSSLLPLLRAQGHAVIAPTWQELDLFYPAAVSRAVRDVDAVEHLATSIPPPERMGEPAAWRMNDRLRAEASRILVDAALKSNVDVYVQPTVTFVYPPREVADETTPLGDVPEHLRSALSAEKEAARFTVAGRRGVVLRLGLLYGPKTGLSMPDLGASNAVLQVDDTGRALLAALTAPAGVYNVVADGGLVSNERFKSATGWRPRPLP